MPYKPTRPIRIVTAASLFDGHDASINIMRRILQDMGAEVIHLGHNRSVQDVVTTALQEGAQGIAVSSYQGGHMEYFKFMKDLLVEAGAPYVKIFGGGGGVIVHDEKKELEDYGIDCIFHPDDGRRLGLEGMIELIVKTCDYDIQEAAAAFKKEGKKAATPAIMKSNPIQHRDLGLALTAVELGGKPEPVVLKSAAGGASSAKSGGAGETTPLVLGVTGTGGAGKSSLVDELIQRFLNTYPNIKIGVVCVDPSKQKTGGGLLGDRIRMNSLSRDGVYMRSMASRGSGREISDHLPAALKYLKKCNFDLLIAETSGIGQGSSAILDVCDVSLYVMTAEFGAQSQLEKIDMIDFANLIAINKADRRGAQDAHRDVIKQYRRSRKLFHDTGAVPVYLTQASNFNDKGVNELFVGISEALVTKNSEAKAGDAKKPLAAFDFQLTDKQKSSLAGAVQQTIVPAERQNYLAQIVGSVRDYKKATNAKTEAARQYQALELSEQILLGDQAAIAKNPGLASLQPLAKEIQAKKMQLRAQFSDQEWEKLTRFDDLVKAYSARELSYSVRGKEIKQPLVKASLSGIEIPRVAIPQSKDWGERFKFLALENVPGEFPYTAGTFQLKRTDEEPIRMFAGEGPAERTNKRFHFLSQDLPVKRLSTAFDSVTLYGNDPDLRPDIYGKVGESGVSISSLEDMKRLYAGFDLCDPKTSVSMTINGPAPMILAFFMNTAIDQQVEKKEKELGRKLNEAEHKEAAAYAQSQVRGTVQADILKEDQGQNTCIFSIDFALKMMGDIQEYFTRNNVRNFYSVSISGYHIAEAGANPISQVAFTLSNAFTFVEYYLSRGLNIDEFAPNLSFFFSNGLDPEYTVIGRVARRIWAIAIRDLYKGNDRSQKLKYHIQTSGRSLHAQEIDFNDIRTTLQALLAINDNCNSLHTNAYDEAITTPTEASVRRAQAIQLIINREFGLTYNENPMQGSYLTDWLTDKVEEAVLEEFLKLNARGGVLGAMETQYQRGKIQEESLYYEMLKHNGQYPIIGVNTFVDPKTLEAGYVPPKIELARATAEEKKMCLDRTEKYKVDHNSQAAKELESLKQVALSGGNVFGALMSAARHCTLHQMTQALFEVGGQYRRNI